MTTASADRIQVFFNRPARPLPIGGLVREIREERHLFCVASAWFTDTKIAEAIVKSPARIKVVLLNDGDLKRGSYKAYEMLDAYFLERFSGRSRCSHAAIDGQHILGSKDWREGVMHHKFALIGTRVLWVGSYNLTYQAQQNYENILRIEGRGPCLDFWREAVALCGEHELFSGSTQSASANGAFRCAHCEKLFKNERLAPGYEEDSNKACDNCAEKLRAEREREQAQSIPALAATARETLSKIHGEVARGELDRDTPIYELAIQQSGNTTYDWQRLQTARELLGRYPGRGGIYITLSQPPRFGEEVPAAKLYAGTFEPSASTDQQFKAMFGPDAWGIAA